MAAANARDDAVIHAQRFVEFETQGPNAICLSAIAWLVGEFSCIRRARGRGEAEPAALSLTKGLKIVSWLSEERVPMHLKYDS